MPVLLQIALGGALGSLLRFGAVSLAARLFGAGFPVGTGLVNVTGSFVIGALFVLLTSRPELGLARHAPFLMPGLLGGFTTFSAFSLETLTLVEDGRLPQAAAYVAGTLGLGLGAVFLGAWLARHWSPA